MVYNNKHKIILQTVMHEGALSENDGKELVKKLFDHDDAVQILSEINAKLRSLDMIIKCINCEVTGKLYWILTSTVQDTTAKFHLEYSQAELTLLRNIYSEIVTSNNGFISSTWCLNLCSSLNIKLSKINAEEFLQDMVKKKWLSYKDGQYYMGVRSIAELLQYFKDTYEENLRTCSLCKQELFYGDKCESCETITHTHCLKTYATDQNNLKCPNCHLSISGLDHFDNDINTTINIDNKHDETNGMSQLSQKRRSKRKHQN